MSADSLNNSSEIPLITFNSLYNILREEKKSKTLQKLPEKFFEALIKFLSDKKNEITKLKGDNNKEKLKREMHVLNNSKKIIQELMSMRCIKISNIAIKNSIFQDEILNSSNVLPQEKDFFDQVNTNINKLLKATINK